MADESPPRTLFAAEVRRGQGRRRGPGPAVTERAGPSERGPQREKGRGSVRRTDDLRRVLSRGEDDAVGFVDDDDIEVEGLLRAEDARREIGKEALGDDVVAEDHHRGRGLAGVPGLPSRGNHDRNRLARDESERRPGPSAPPLPPPDFRREEGPWRAFVRHRAGSLDAVVGRARARNLALGSGVLFLLGMSIVLVTVSARRATELSERKMEFVAGVSHELRTPLAVIRSAAQNLADGSVSGGPQVRRYGGLIEAEGRRLEDLVEKVLELAGVQSQNQHSPRERVSITGIARSAIADSAAEARERGIEVEADLPAADLFVLGDEDGLRRGVANLVGNAIKHGGEDNAVRVSVQSLSGEVSISVSDRGPGIPPSEVPHLFEAFYRGRRARERQVRGSGLGLSLVQQIAREHGGRVEVETNPGKGSRFSLILPMARSPEGSVE